MHVLVTNDDGVHAPGLAALEQVARRELGQVTVVAPDREQSGVAHALTLRQPLRCTPVREGWFAVEGTPTDCVNLAVFELMRSRPDLVLSGVNAGFNVADDVTYSGTVAAALEGRLLGVPSLAVSTAAAASCGDFHLAALVACRLARRLLDEDLPEGVFYNLNVPPGARSCRVTEQGRRADPKGFVEGEDPRGGRYYWLGLRPARWEPDPRSDHEAVAQGVASLTPLHADMTHRGAAERLRATGFDGALPE